MARVFLSVGDVGSSDVLLNGCVRVLDEGRSLVFSVFFGEDGRFVFCELGCCPGTTMVSKRCFWDVKSGRVDVVLDAGCLLDSYVFEVSCVVGRVERRVRSFRGNGDVVVVGLGNGAVEDRGIRCGDVVLVVGRYVRPVDGGFCLVEVGEQLVRVLNADVRERCS